MQTTSALYRGMVMHHRHRPQKRRFSYQLQWLYLNLDEVEQCVSQTSLLSTRRFGFISFYEPDHYENPSSDLREASLADIVRARLKNAGIEFEKGPICLLTQPRSLGSFFCPLSVYYCFDASGSRLNAIVAEVTNTPWKERHDYVIDLTGETAKDAYNCTTKKDFHVSPFLPMDMEYRWRLLVPDEWLTLAINCVQNESCMLTSTIRLQRKPISSKALAAERLRRPFASLSILSAIYYEALVMWLKRAQYHPHP